MGWAREVSLAQAGLTASAIYLCAFAMRGGDGLGLAVPGLRRRSASASAVLMSLLVALATARLSGIYIIILTLALQVTIEKTIFSNITLIETAPEHTIPRPAFFGVHLESDRAYFLFALAVLGLVILFLARLRASRFGRGLMLAGTDRQAASAVGVSPWRAKIFAFVLAGVLRRAGRSCHRSAVPDAAELHQLPGDLLAHLSRPSRCWPGSGRCWPCRSSPWCSP